MFNGSARRRELRFGADTGSQIYTKNLDSTMIRVQEIKIHEVI